MHTCIYTYIYKFISTYNHICIHHTHGYTHYNIHASHYIISHRSIATAYMHIVSCIDTYIETDRHA